MRDYPAVSDPWSGRSRPSTRVIVAVVSLALIVTGGVTVWRRLERPPDERALLSRLSPLLPGLAGDAQSKPSTYPCDDDATEPCHAVTRTWVIADASMTLSRLDAYLSRWAKGNHLTRPGRTDYRLQCNSAVDATTGLPAPRITCLAPMSTSWVRRSVDVMAVLTRKTAANGGNVADPLRALADARIVNVSVRAVVYPREDG